MKLQRLIFLFLVALVATIFIRTFVIETIYVATPSMEPTLPVSTNYLLEKISYRFHPPRRGDIIVFKSPVEPGKDLIKRVIAVAGDRIEMREKKVVLNGSEQNEPYTRYTRTQERLLGDTMPEMIVPGGTVFVLGDNRDESGDSTSWKDPKTGTPIHFVPRSSIKGRIIKGK